MQGALQILVDRQAADSVRFQNFDRLFHQEGVHRHEIALLSFHIEASICVPQDEQRPAAQVFRVYRDHRLALRSIEIPHGIGRLQRVQPLIDPLILHRNRNLPSVLHITARPRHQENHLSCQSLSRHLISALRCKPSDLRLTERGKAVRQLIEEFLFYHRMYFLIRKDVQRHCQQQTRIQLFHRVLSLAECICQSGNGSLRRPPLLVGESLWIM